MILTKADVRMLRAAFREAYRNRQMTDLEFIHVTEVLDAAEARIEGQWFPARRVS